MKRVLLVTAALVAAVVVWIALSLPPRPIALDASLDDGTVAGILHVHTRRSDGLGDPDSIAAAAARAGLRFVVLTDHGDGTRAPDAPTYRHGVLCIDAVEISTSGGHYVALGLAQTPYPLAGDPRDVVEDVRRLGGFGIAAHPDSPKTELAWQDGTSAVDGIEILNLDSEWRAQLLQRGWKGRLRLANALLTYPLRPSETIGALLTPSAGAKATWTGAMEHRPVVGIGAADAHARLELLGGRDSGRLTLPVPGYDASFRALSVHVLPTGPLTGDPAVDATRVLAGIRNGQIYTAVDAWAGAPRFTFTIAGADRTASLGGSVRPADPLRLRVTHNGGDGFLMSVFNGTRVVASDRRESVVEESITAPGAYRVEIRDPRHSDGPPWLTSNPIYVRADSRPSAPTTSRPAADTRPGTYESLFDGRTVAGWTIESDSTSLSAVTVAPLVDGPALRVRYGLAGGPNSGQFAGVAVDTLNGAREFDRVAFRLRGERPMRVSLQARIDVSGAPPERWQRSIYVDDTERTYSVFFDDMTAVGVTHSATPPVAIIRNLMFIVDTTNTKPGASGNLWLRDVRLAHP